MKIGVTICEDLETGGRQWHFPADSARKIEAGFDRTIDLSSSGLRFAAHGPLEPGLILDVAIDWPVPIDGGVHLQLVATGVVVWGKGTETGMRIQRHELRTRRVELKVAPPRESAD